jgi:hypothetical protein
VRKEKRKSDAAKKAEEKAAAAGPEIKEPGDAKHGRRNCLKNVFHQKTNYIILLI